MKVQKQQTYNNYNKKPSFKGFTDLMMSNVFLNKAMFDLTGSDIPWVVMANNKEERRERINRASLSVGLIFLSPLLLLPLVNRFAMSKIVKLTPKLLDNNYNAIRLSNKHLVNAETTEEGLKELSQKPLSNEVVKLFYKLRKKPVPEEKINVEELLKNAKGADLNSKYEDIRKKIITAKNIVLGTDLFLVSGTFGHIGFFNNWQTEKKSGQIGYSAELKMADKEVIEKRAAKFKKQEKIRYGVFLTALAGLTVGMPMAIRHGLIHNKGNFGKFIQKHSEKFDYIDAIFMKRLPLALTFFGAQCGIFMASRNNTERKDNIIRGSNVLAIFFLGDLLLASLLGKASDKLFGTKILKEKPEKTLLNKLLPPVKDLNELKATKCPKTVRNAKAIFWINFTFLSAMMGIITPHIINKIIKKDVNQDAEKTKKL